MTEASEDAAARTVAPGPPARAGYFGRWGGSFAPETLVGPLADLGRAMDEALADAGFRAELRAALARWVGRPTPLSDAPRLSARLGCEVFLKREDLAHTGAHKINNSLGQCLIARRLGKRRVIAETGAGQHGVATAAAAARLGLEATIYMGSVDMERQALNVWRMRLMGAEVRGVDSGQRTLKDAINEAMRDWVTNAASSHYVLGSALGPHPYPTLVRELQRVIGDEARAQMLEHRGRLPDVALACVGGGSNAIGLFTAFVGDAGVALVGVEAGGDGEALGRHAARFGGGTPGVLHGTRTLVLQDADGQVAETRSVSAGLDYPAVGPEHVGLRDAGRARYERATDAQALAGFRALAETEGIIPALESAHAIGWLCDAAPSFAGQVVLVNVSGRGDKDMEIARRALADAAEGAW